MEDPVVENQGPPETTDQNDPTTNGDPPKRKTSWTTLRREVSQQLGELDLSETESTSEGPEKLVLLMQEGENEEEGNYLENCKSYLHIH